MFQIFFFMCPGTTENYNYVKKRNTFTSSYSIPIVRIQADFAHLKLLIKIVSENTWMWKLGRQQCWNLTLIFKAKKKLAKKSKSVGVFWPHQLLKDVEVAVFRFLGLFFISL